MARRAKPSKPARSAAPPKPHPSEARVTAFRLGLSAESRAAFFLLTKAYRIVARRWKTPFGEIDIIARRRNDLVFVEVKARENFEDAAEAVSDHSKQRILVAANLWLARHPEDTQCAIRFDVILMAPGKLPRHIVNAFDATR